MHKVHIFLGKTAVVKHANPLFEYHAASGVSFNQWLVSHVKSSHELEDWDLDWKVEGRNHTDRSIWHSVRGVKLSGVISRLSLGVSQKPYAISAEVLKEVNCDCQLGVRLDATLWHTSLDQINEEVHHFFVVHRLDNLAVNFGKHQVAFLVFEWVVQAVLRASLQTLYEWSDFVHLGVWVLDENLASIERVDDIFSFSRGSPLTPNQVVTLVFCAQTFGVNCREGF